MKTNPGISNPTFRRDVARILRIGRRTIRRCVVSPAERRARNAAFRSDVLAYAEKWHPVVDASRTFGHGGI